MSRIYKVEVFCPICDWHADDWAPSQLGILPIEESLEELAAEHQAKTHTVNTKNLKSKENQ